MSRRRGAMVLAVLCCAGGLAGSPSASAAPARAAGWTITRTGPGPAVLSGTLTGSAGSAEAPGGRYGSLGWAHLPCDQSGKGSADLTGGPHAWTVDCERAVFAVSTTTSVTRWRLAGQAVGTGSVVNVLVVVDFPASI